MSWVALRSFGRPDELRPSVRQSVDRSSSVRRKVSNLARAECDWVSGERQGHLRDPLPLGSPSGLCLSFKSLIVVVVAALVVGPDVVVGDDVPAMKKER